MRRTLILIAAFSLGVALLSSGFASAQSETSTVTGSMNGDRGGAHVTWDVDLPADTDASLRLAYWPCLNPGAFELEVWGPNSMLGKASQTGGCEKSLNWNTGDGGPVTIRFSNYLHGVATNYSVSAEGFSLPGGSAPATMADDAAMDADAATDDEAMADDATTADDAAMADDEAMADEGEAMAGDDTAMGISASGETGSTASGTLLGNSGGAFATHEMQVTNGTTYTLEMTRGMDVGGNWPAVGFHVWGPNGLVASSSMSYGSNASATFTATMDGTYTVQMYNYHHGNTMFYALHVTEGGDDM